MTIITTFEETSWALMKYTWVVPTTLSTSMRLTIPLHHTTIRICRFGSQIHTIVSLLFLATGSVTDDRASPFCFCWKDNSLALLFSCVDSFPVLALLWLQSSLSLSFSSSTYCIYTIYLNIFMSPINIIALPSLLDIRKNQPTKKNL